MIHTLHYTYHLINGCVISGRKNITWPIFWVRLKFQGNFSNSLWKDIQVKSQIYSFKVFITGDITNTNRFLLCLWSYINIWISYVYGRQRMSVKSIWLGWASHEPLYTLTSDMANMWSNFLYGGNSSIINNSSI